MEGVVYDVLGWYWLVEIDTTAETVVLYCILHSTVGTKKGDSELRTTNHEIPFNMQYRIAPCVKPQRTKKCLASSRVRVRKKKYCLYMRIFGAK